MGIRSSPEGQEATYRTMRYGGFVTRQIYRSIPNWQAAESQIHNSSTSPRMAWRSVMTDAKNWCK